MADQLSKFFNKLQIFWKIDGFHELQNKLLVDF